MLERIMNLQILLCIMAAAGAFGAVGMLAVHLLAEELCEEQMQSQALRKNG